VASEGRTAREAGRATRRAASTDVASAPSWAIHGLRAKGIAALGMHDSGPYPEAIAFEPLDAVDYIRRELSDGSCLYLQSQADLRAAASDGVPGPRCVHKVGVTGTLFASEGASLAAPSPVSGLPREYQFLHRKFDGARRAKLRTNTPVCSGLFLCHGGVMTEDWLKRERARNVRRAIYLLAAVSITAAVMGVCIFLIPAWVRPSTTAPPDSPDPTVTVDLPSDASQPAVAHLPPDVLHRDSPPNVAEVWTGAGTLLLALTAIIAAGATAVGLLQARDAEHARTFTKVATRWNADPILSIRRTLLPYIEDSDGKNKLATKMIELRNARDPEFWKLSIMLDYFEDLATLVKYRAISIEMVDSMFSVRVCRYWVLWNVYINKIRTDPNDPGYDPEYFEEYGMLAKRLADMHKNVPPWVV
jgi:hypothetical protein